MKSFVAAALALGLMLFAAHAQGEEHVAAAFRPALPEPAASDSAWTRPLQEVAEGGVSPSIATAVAAEPEPQDIAPEIDVVDAHWMALTMWGEGRSQGDAGMRAIGHVIHNRSLQGHRRFVTDTVSAAYQFSCWNKGDPNREKMLNIDSLGEASPDRVLWLRAKEIANEIISGRSEDPTGGALFYHTAAVSPKWSAGVQPIRIIGDHLFFRHAR